MHGALVRAAPTQASGRSSQVAPRGARPDGGLPSRTVAPRRTEPAAGAVGGAGAGAGAAAVRTRVKPPLRSYLAARLRAGRAREVTRASCRRRPRRGPPRPRRLFRARAIGASRRDERVASSSAGAATGRARRPCGVCDAGFFGAVRVVLPVGAVGGLLDRGDERVVRQLGVRVVAAGPSTAVAGTVDVRRPGRPRGFDAGFFGSMASQLGFWGARERRRLRRARAAAGPPTLSLARPAAGGGVAPGAPGVGRRRSTGAKTGPSITAKTVLVDGGGRGRGMMGASRAVGRAQVVAPRVLAPPRAAPEVGALRVPPGPCGACARSVVSSAVIVAFLFLHCL